MDTSFATFCAQCGSSLSNGPYCPRCGTRAAPPQAHAELPTTQVPKTKNASVNGFAVASLILGLVWIYGIGSILAIVFGQVAANQIEQTRQAGRGMALAGQILGVIGVCVIMLAILAAMLGTGTDS